MGVVVKGCFVTLIYCHWNINLSRLHCQRPAIIYCTAFAYDRDECMRVGRSSFPKLIMKWELCKNVAELSCVRLRRLDSYLPQCPPPIFALFPSAFLHLSLKFPIVPFVHLAPRGKLTFPTPFFACSLKCHRDPMLRQMTIPHVRLWHINLCTVGIGSAAWFQSLRTWSGSGPRQFVWCDECSYRV